MDRDEGLEELAGCEHWDQHLHCPVTELTDCSVYKKMLAKIFVLKDMWRHREPKVCTKMLLCQNPVFGENILYFRPKGYFATVLYSV